MAEEQSVAQLQQTPEQPAQAGDQDHATPALALPVPQATDYQGITKQLSSIATVFEKPNATSEEFREATSMTVSLANEQRAMLDKAAVEFKKMQDELAKVQRQNNNVKVTRDIRTMLSSLRPDVKFDFDTVYDAVMAADAAGKNPTEMQNLLEIQKAVLAKQPSQQPSQQQELQPQAEKKSFTGARAAPYNMKSGHTTAEARTAPAPGTVNSIMTYAAGEDGVSYSLHKEPAITLSDLKRAFLGADQAHYPAFFASLGQAANPQANTGKSFDGAEFFYGRPTTN